jgi:hypothetical protein
MFRVVGTDDSNSPPRLYKLPQHPSAQLANERSTENVMA